MASLAGLTGLAPLTSLAAVGLAAVSREGFFQLVHGCFQGRYVDLLHLAVVHCGKVDRNFRLCGKGLQPQLNVCQVLFPYNLVLTRHLMALLPNRPSNYSCCRCSCSHIGPWSGRSVSRAALADALAGLAGTGLAFLALASLAGLALLAGLAKSAVPAVVHVGPVGSELFQGRLEFRHMDGLHLQFAGICES